MTPERHALIKEVFLGAIGHPPEDRSVYMQQRCGDDVELRREVELLIAHHNDETTAHDTTAPTVATDAWRKDAPGINLELEAALTPSQHPPAPGPTAPQVLEPGTIVGDRFKITALLGRGGMGVVYQAEDNVLSLTVALKFLNPEMANNAVWLERFRNEVRAAREITHSNMCRIFDIGECDGLHFISMEYVDGEDLTKLLRRIGRLPHEKAIDIARQLCVGLAAAHGAGFLHRDLKPANVMLDGQGQVRITDFGLAAAPDTIGKMDVRSGTPAYMAPEQIAGREVTVRSDIYALGLLLYELFSGRQAFEADSIESFAYLHATAEPRQLSDIVSDVDPEVERIIEQCLQKRPQDRPASALAVAAALPGVNPLAVALAANQTPSPELVAASTPAYAPPASVGRLFMLSIILLVGVVLVRALTASRGEHNFGRQPAVLIEDAREAIQGAGYSIDAKDFAFGYASRRDAEAIIPAAAAHVQRGPSLATEANLVFWYRQSSAWLVPTDVKNVAFGSGRVTLTDPPLSREGETLVVLSSLGRLLLFLTHPAVESMADPLQDAEERARTWLALLESAEIDAPAITSEQPRQATPFLGDEAMSWSGVRVQGGTSDLSVEGAAWMGRPISFAVLADAEPNSQADWISDAARRQFLVETSLRILLLVATGVALPWAWRNHLRGSVDHRGALRLAIVVLSTQLLAWVIRVHHAPSFNGELLRMCLGILAALGMAAQLALFYSALEPYARRHWPELLISWSRAVSARTIDPVVGLHVLIGVCVGLGWALVMAGDVALVDWFGWSARPALTDNQLAAKVLGSRLALASYLGAVPTALLHGLLLLLLLAGLRTRLGRPIWAGVLATVVLIPLVVPRGAHLGTAWLTMGVLIAGSGVWVMSRFGFIAIATALLVSSIINTSPMTLDPRSWYFNVTLFAAGSLIALAVLALLAARKTVATSAGFRAG